MNIPLLRKLYWKLEKRIVPDLTSSQHHYRDALFAVLPESAFHWLDLGCGHQVFADWMTADQNRLVERAEVAVGIDLDLPALKAHPGLRYRIYGDLTHIPLRDQTFDVITANMVVEHLDRPDLVFREVQRLLRPGGVFVFHTTNARNPFLAAAARIPQGLKNRMVYMFEHRKAEDVFPTHYRANQPGDIRALAASTGFECRALELVSSSAFTQMLGPLVVFELLYIRLLRRKRFEHLRPNIICILKKVS